MEKEILRLNHLRDVASEKGHKKGYPFVTLYFTIFILFHIIDCLIT